MDLHKFYQEGIQALQYSNAELHKILGDYAGEMRTGFARLEERLASAMHSFGQRATKHSDNMKRIEGRVESVDERAESRDEAILLQLKEIAQQLHSVREEQARRAGMWRGVALTASAIGAILGAGVPLLLHVLGVVKVGG